MVVRVDFLEAKSKFSKLMDRVENGDSFIIIRDGVEFLLIPAEIPVESKAEMREQPLLLTNHSGRHR